MWIPYGSTHYNTATGKARKRVKCEWCETAYQYDLEREVTGTSKNLLFLDGQGASDRAADRAQEKLESAIRYGVDPVPCPSCGKYQEDMFDAARNDYHLALYFGSIGSLILTFVFLVIGVNITEGRKIEMMPLWTKASMLTCLLLAGFAYLLRKWLTARMDPNDEPLEQRQAIATERCIPITDDLLEDADDVWE